MTWANILLVWIALASSTAYRQIHYPSYYERVRQYRSPFADVGTYGSVDRSQNERSIPFSSSFQRVEGRPSQSNDAQPRSGNISHRYNPFSKNHAGVSIRGSFIDSDSVVFPGPTSRPHLFEPEVPKECMETGICENVPNYPHEIVNNLLSKIKDAKYRFTLEEETPEIAQRTGAEEENIELCEHNETILYPSAAKNIQGKWVFVVNKPNEPVQGFKAEMCKGTNRTCSDIAYFDTDKYNATCQQKRANRMMWVLDRNGEMVLETISMPTCCTCIVSIIKTNV